MSTCKHYKITKNSNNYKIFKALYVNRNKKNKNKVKELVNYVEEYVMFEHDNELFVRIAFPKNKTINVDFLDFIELQDAEDFYRTKEQHLCQVKYIRFA